jgi:hypothetical protein
LRKEFVMSETYAVKRINILGDGSKTYDALIFDGYGQVEIEFPSESRVDQMLDLLTSACYEIRDDVTRYT